MKRTLEALDHQEGYGAEAYEAVVVDDGSEEDVLGYIKEVNSNYPLNYIHLDRTPGSCRSRSRNYGIKAARGRYVIFIDDDMVVGKDYLKQLDRYYQYSQDLVIVGTRVNCPVDMLETLEPGEIKKMAFTDEHAVEMLEERHVAFNSLSYNLAAQQYPWMMTSTCNLVVPRKQLMRIGGFDETFLKWGFEDMELGYRLYKNKAGIVVNSRLTTFHQDHPAAPEGGNNFNHFVKKCREVFHCINPVQLMTVYGQNTDDPALLKTFRSYRGDITARKTVTLTGAGELETVKQTILEYSEQKGCEITVLDHAEDTDLDIWCQLLPVKEAVVHYLPQSFRLSKRTAAAVMNHHLTRKTGRTEGED